MDSLWRWLIVAALLTIPFYAYRALALDLEKYAPARVLVVRCVLLFLASLLWLVFISQIFS